MITAMGMRHPIRARARLKGWEDACLAPELELVVGCVLLVLSGIYWWTSTGGIFKDWQDALATVTVVLGPWFVYRAWKRKQAAVRCGTCGGRVPIFEIPENDKPEFYVLDCPRCGARYLAPAEG
jgi:hypothetical protein